MDKQTEPKITDSQAREELRSAKARLSAQAEKISLKEYMAEHPYISLGVAFLSGALLGGSQEGRKDVAKTVAEVITKEVINQGKQDS